MTNRISISGTRVLISRPGVDVLSPPAYTPDYLMMDSNWGQPERPLQVGVILNKSLNDNHIQTFGVTYTEPPAVGIYISESGAVRQIDLISDSSNWFVPYQLNITRSQFTLGGNGLNGGFHAVARNWFFALWQSW
jgi:hypothetical protein